MTHDTKRFDITGPSTTKATAPRAQLLTSTSPSTLHRPRGLKSQTSSGYIATWLERHQGHSARSLVAHFDDPSMHFKQTGSLLQFSLTSSPLNTYGRAPTIYIDEPSTTLQKDGLLPTILIDELSPQHRWTSSYYLH